RERYIHTKNGRYRIKHLGSIWLILLIVFAGMACNLAVGSAPTAVPTIAPSLGETPTLAPPITIVVRGTPTLITLPGSQSTTVPVTSVPALGTQCQVYTTYSGVKAENKLSLRSGPSASATQIYRVPNFAEVLLVPNSSEIEADGYHWLNVIYVAPAGTRYQGWMARDSFAVNGLRDPSIATLQSTGRQAAC
ncbi:MAG: hypothetical protein KC615_24890, partial [Anaerolineae bacterium]|nr:hypothetical protein [Anaerolineae bacterium]